MTAAACREAAQQALAALDGVRAWLVAEIARLEATRTGRRRAALTERDPATMATIVAGVLIGLVVALLVWRHWRSWRARLAARGLAKPAATVSLPELGIRVTVSAGPRPAEPDPWGDEDRHPDYPLHVVGESYHQDALRAIVQAAADPGPNWPYHGAQCAVTARLTPEPDNPHDDHAVRVDIQGRVVGHLGRADARQYRTICQTESVTVPALIVGGWDHRDRDPTDLRAVGSFGVRLQLALPKGGAAVDEIATASAVGHGAAVDPDFPVDVRGELSNQAVLERLCGGRTAEGVDRIVPARCVADADGDVRVEIDGAIIGQLFAAAAWHYRLTMPGATACRARIRGGWDCGLHDMGNFGVRLDLALPTTHPGARGAPAAVRPGLRNSAPCPSGRPRRRDVAGRSWGGAT